MAISPRQNPIRHELLQHPPPLSIFHPRIEKLAGSVAEQLRWKHSYWRGRDGGGRHTGGRRGLVWETQTRRVPAWEMKAVCVHSENLS